MSEVVEGGAVTTTAGALLREAREASGVHIAALAVALKVPVGKLEALEADNHAALPDTVFVRALASSVCRTLKVDSGPILSLLPQSQSPRLAADSAGLNAPVKASVGKSASSAASFSSSSNARSRSVSLVVLALLVGAVVVFFFPRQPVSLSFLHPSPPPTSEESAQSVRGEAVPMPTTPTPMPAASVVENVPVNVETPSVDRSTVAPAARPAASTADAVAAVPAAAAASLPASAAASASGTLVLRARSQSWVQVKDSAGAVVLQRNLAADESVSVSAPAPLAVVIGRADATEVFVRGKPFDLAGVSRENVARFEVK
ncbi:RodZ domain-containing protein [Acidovorax sp. sic0104]|uniref:helix-turn-helix domain-containing protein n=1 Tax=Acidovorax sp. sic0104 TaxID=2854784 RepID=UPI001C48F98F|nr:RodZ domain-containing protein [Acidovorax sp. sic0104]MBV7544069.1 helix-turn-helix domain-containing protein [Acidovorax sp. sic0104]